MTQSGRRATDWTPQPHSAGEAVVATALGDVKVELANLNGSFNTLAAELRSQSEQHSQELKRLEGEQVSQGDRLVTVERWQWRVTGIAVGVGAVTGTATSTLVSLLIGG